MLAHRAATALLHARAGVTWSARLCRSPLTVSLSAEWAVWSVPPTAAATPSCQSARLAVAVTDSPTHRRFRTTFERRSPRRSFYLASLLPRDTCVRRDMPTIAGYGCTLESCAAHATILVSWASNSPRRGPRTARTTSFRPRQLRVETRTILKLRVVRRHSGARTRARAYPVPSLITSRSSCCATT